MAKRKDGEERASTTGRRNPPVDQTSWRREMQASRIKFDDIQKKIFCDTLKETGRKYLGAVAAQVSMNTVRAHLDVDPDFTEAVERSMEIYASQFSLEAQRRGVMGVAKPVFYKGARVIEPVLNEDGTKRYNEEGEQIWRYAEIREYSDTLLLAEARRVDPDFREKSSIDLNQKGDTGVLVVGPIVPLDEEEAGLEEVNRKAREGHAQRMQEIEDLRKKHHGSS